MRISYTPTLCRQREALVRLSGNLCRRALRSSDAEMVATGCGGPGLFTNSKPGDRKVVPDDVAGREVFNVVYVVLESQYQASLTTACKRINAGQVRVHAYTRLPQWSYPAHRSPCHSALTE